MSHRSMLLFPRHLLLLVLMACHLLDFKTVQECMHQCCPQSLYRFYNAIKEYWEIAQNSEPPTIAIFVAKTIRFTCFLDIPVNFTCIVLQRGPNLGLSYLIANLTTPDYQTDMV